MSDPLHARQFRLSYADCDPAGILYYAALFPFMERTSTDWWFRNGIVPHRLVETAGVSMVTRATDCEYLAITTLDDLLVCEMRLAALRQRSFTLEYTFVRQPDGVITARSHMSLVTIGPDGAPAPVPEAICDLLEGAR